MIGSLIAAARKSSRLDERMFAHLVDIDEQRLQAVELGQAEATPAEVDRCARLLGLRIRDLLAGAGPKAPMTLLLRSAYEGGSPSLEELDATGAHKSLGEFLRAVRDVADLESLAGANPPALPERRKTPAPPGSHPIEREVRWLRQDLRLGAEPIPSMRALLSEKLGIRLFFTTPEELSQEIDGASTCVPRPAILVNLVGGEKLWWRTRMTLAHELAHILFDSSHEKKVLFSPHRRFLKRPPKGWRWQLFEGFDDIEVRADAFAACFLAPEDGVRSIVGDLDPTTEEAIGKLGAHFGVGRTVAINRLQDVFNLSPEDRAQMESRPPAHWSADFRGDLISGDVGIRQGDLVALVADALRDGKISRSRAWECLCIPPTEALPVEGLPAALTAPLITERMRTLAAAQRHLAAAFPERILHPMQVERACLECHSAESEHADGKCPFEPTSWKQGELWRVALGEGGVGERDLAHVGYILMDAGGHIVEEKVQLPHRPVD